jgi:hypothetical protein
MTPLIAEDLVLLLLDDESGKLHDATYLDIGIGGALLVELALAGNVEVVTEGGWWARAKVVATTASPPADPALRTALETVQEKERTAQDLVHRLGRRRREPLLERLEQAGILRREHGRVLGLFPTTRWPAVDSSHEVGVRHALADALLRGVDPDERTAALVSLLHALDLVHRVLDTEGVPARDVKKRARQVAEGDWAAKAVKDAVVAAQAAVTAAVLASTTAASSGGS